MVSKPSIQPGYRGVLSLRRMFLASSREAQTSGERIASPPPVRPLAPYSPAPSLCTVACQALALGSVTLCRTSGS